MKSSNRIEIYSNPGNLLGESPRWHPEEKSLYWTDIDARVVLRQTSKQSEPEVIRVNVKVGCFGFRKKGGLIMATSNGFSIWHWGQSEFLSMGNPESGKTGARFNDGLVDAKGRFWAGTMTETDATSCLYRLDPDGGLHTMLKNITISNGIGWNGDNTCMYFTDTLMRSIWKYDFDNQTGSLSNRQIFAKALGPGFPDGLSVDTSGNVWSVCCGEGLIVVYNLYGKIVEKIRFPTRCITACAFGGPELSDLFVTSSRSLLNPEERKRDSYAGAVFRLSTSSKGMKANWFLG